MLPCVYYAIYIRQKTVIRTILFSFCNFFYGFKFWSFWRFSDLFLYSINAKRDLRRTTEDVATIPWWSIHLYRLKAAHCKPQRMAVTELKGLSHKNVPFSKWRIWPLNTSKLLDTLIIMWCDVPPLRNGKATVLGICRKITLKLRVWAIIPLR